MNREDLAWAAGLFEGEGNVGLFQSRWSRLGITSTDRDVLEKFQAVFPAMGRIYGPYDQGHKPFWSWQVSKFEHVQAIIAGIWPWLCSRRRARAADVLRADKHLPPRKELCDCGAKAIGRGLCREHWTSPNFCTEDGCDRVMLAKGLCQRHYSRKRHRVLHPDAKWRK